MAPTRWLPLLLAWTLLIQSLAPALASPRPLCAKTPTQSTTHVPSANHAHHQYLVDTSQPYAEVIQEAEWVNNALPLITRYDIGLDRLRMFKYQVTSNGPPPVYSPVLSGWYLFDGLGSTRAVVDDSGVGQSEFGYGDAFGIPYQVAANGTRASAGAGFFLNGQQWDGSGVWNSGEGLYFNRARYYQPGLGRFIGEDPEIGENYQPVTLHRYLYGSSDSVNNIDPSGRDTSLFGLTISNLIASSLTGALSVATINAWKYALSGADSSQIAKAAGEGAIVGGLSGFAGAWVGGAISTLAASTGSSIVVGAIAGAASGAISNVVKQSIENYLRLMESDGEFEWKFNLEEFYISTATAGLAGGIVAKIQGIQGVPVSTWASRNPEIAPGKWVMLGKPNIVRWILTGTAKLRGPLEKFGYTLYKDSATASVSAAEIKAIPLEVEFGPAKHVVWLIKTLMGQRKL